MKKRYARILAATLSAAMVFTSAPTAVFATELSVSEDAVEAEGIVATQADADALFPTKLKYEYQGATIYNVDGASPVALTAYSHSSNVAGYVSDDEYAKLGDLNAGDSITLTLKINVTSKTEWDFSNVQGYKYDENATNGDKAVIEKTYKLVCEKSVFDDSAALYNEATAATVTGTYGSSEVSLDTTAKNKGWTIKSVSPNVSKASIKKGDPNVTVKDGVIIQSKSLADVDVNEDLAKYAEGQSDSKFTYNSVTKRLEYVCDVTVSPKNLTSIDFPRSFTSKVYVGDTADDLAKKLASSTTKEGTFTVTGATTAASDSVVFTVTFAADSNHSASGLTPTSKFAAPVYKKQISDKESVPAVPVASQKVTYGTTYGTYLGVVNTANSSALHITYALPETIDADAVIPVGTKTIPLVAQIKSGDDANYEFTNGTLERAVSVPIEVTEPTVGITYQDDNTDADLKAYSYAYNSVGAAKTITAAPKCDYLAMSAISGYAKYEWYKNGKLVTTEKSISIPVTAISNAQYVCKMTYDITDAELLSACSSQQTVADSIKALIAGKTFETEPFTVSVTDIGSTLTVADFDYGTTDKAVAVEFKRNDLTYAVTGVTAYVGDDKGNKYPVTDRILSTTPTSSNTDAYLVVIPNGLDANRIKADGTLEAIDYTLYVELSTSKLDSRNNTLTDVCVAKDDFNVNQVALSAAGALSIDTKDGLTVPYGTKTSDIKVLVDGKPCKYGTLVVDNTKDYIGYQTTTATATKFTPSDETKKNYTAGTIGANAYGNVNLAVSKATLTVKANDVTVNVGQSVPSIGSIQKNYTVSGIVANDKESLLIEKVELKYNGTIDTSKAGTVSNAIFVDVTPFTNPNYTIKTVKGNVIVKDSSVVAPSVKPTPAPVKQAVAAAPKAAKAKVSVKAGKKYTLKLKYAAGKKATVKSVTWKSSKKSVATVSSKGKVTAVKAGKATIAATITFKDGSKKKVKFTVTVK